VSESLTQAALKAHVSYDPITGLFTRLIASQKTLTGELAGWEYNGYTYLRVDNTAYKAHRLAFLYMTGGFPAEHVDHINGIRDDNRWANLREVTNAENTKNRRLNKNNKSGVPGVKYKKSTARWEVYAGGSPRFYIGSSKNWFEAVCMRKSAELRHNCHPNHGRPA
jgi:hypothetical protein